MKRVIQMNSKRSSLFISVQMKMKMKNYCKFIREMPLLERTFYYILFSVARKVSFSLWIVKMQYWYFMWNINDWLTDPSPCRNKNMVLLISKCSVSSQQTFITRNHHQIQIELNFIRGLARRTSVASWLQSNSRPYSRSKLVIISTHR